MTRIAWGAGFTTVAADGTTLDAWFRWLGWGELGTEAPAEVDAALAGGDRADATRRVTIRPTRLTIDVDAPPASTADVYLRLHLLSHRLRRARSINLDGIFGHLATVAWTDLGPVAPADVDDVRLALRGERSGADHPRARQVPADDRLRRARPACASPTRHGSASAPTSPPGTTVMHEGFCNFNAGTLGTSMVEGRISQGVIVGDGSDIGGGSSIMGTLSGGGTEQVTIGERCLLGANAGIGISLGDDCVVEAGLYVTAGTLVRLPDGGVVKARELSGINGMMFIRHSQTGAVEARQRTGSWGGLNEALHAN